MLLVGETFVVIEDGVIASITSEKPQAYDQCDLMETELLTPGFCKNMSCTEHAICLIGVQGWYLLQSEWNIDLQTFWSKEERTTT